MKIKLLSDLHIWKKQNEEYIFHGEDVCILAGDIAEGFEGVEWALQNIPSHVQVLYIPGNHEYYMHDFTLLNERFLEHNTNTSHVRVLLNSYTDILGVRFVGTTLFTDFNLYGTPTVSGMDWLMRMNDSLYITNNKKSIGIQDYLNWHSEAVQFLEKETSSSPELKRVLITHYCPEWSISGKFASCRLNPAFASKIPKHIHSKFFLHLHGHTHDSLDYTTSYGTRVLCNPKGYGNENPLYSRGLLIDV